MKIIKKNKTLYEIETNIDLIYISKEKNPNTKDLYLYFVDVFDMTRITCLDIDPYDYEVFDDLYLAQDYIQNNYNIPDNIINQIIL